MCNAKYAVSWHFSQYLNFNYKNNANLYREFIKSFSRATTLRRYNFHQFVRNRKLFLSYVTLHVAKAILMNFNSRNPESLTLLTDFAQLLPSEWLIISLLSRSLITYFLVSWSFLDFLNYVFLYRILLSRPFVKNESCWQFQEK